tara:strand:- start:580 stop:1059 length:480 start_codon:yes stop_codon:yes gene_type:complete
MIIYKSIESPSKGESPSVSIRNLPMPPSVNKAYMSIGRGRRALSIEGKTYKRSVIDSLIPHVASDKILTSFVKPDLPLSLHIHLFFKDIENKGWPKKAKTRYKRLDVSNRIKLLEDALFECLGVDDCNVFEVTVVKEPSETLTNYVHVTLRSFDGVRGG